MKAVFLWCLFAASGLAQAVPGTYPYPVPLPVVGATPAGTIKATGPINTPGYADNRASIWDVFVGGGYRSVNSTAERDAILSGRRKQGMLVWVAANDHTYKLATNLTTWADLGVIDMASAGNIYNLSGSLTGNRTLTGAGFNLDFVGLSNFGAVGSTSITLAAPNVNLNGGSFTTINGDGPDPFIFPAAPAIPAGTYEIMARNPATDEVTYGPSYTLAELGGAWTQDGDLAYLTAFPNAVVIDGMGTNTLTINNTNAIVGGETLARFQQQGTNKFVVDFKGTASAIHFGGFSSTPTIVTNSGAGLSGATVTIVGTDAAGEITINSGLTPAVGAAAVTVTFATAYSGDCYVVLWPAGTNASTLGFLPWVDGSTTGFSVNNGAALGLAGSTTYKYNYIVMQ